MITAVVLVKAAADQIPETAQAIADLTDVTEVYSCAGNSDVNLIAIVRVTEPEQLTDIITNRLSHSHGVLNINTHIALRYYSRKDTEAAFWLGFNDDTQH